MGGGGAGGGGPDGSAGLGGSGFASATIGPGVILTAGTGGAGGSENSNRLRLPPSMGTCCILASTSLCNVGSTLLTSKPSGSLMLGWKSWMLVEASRVESRPRAGVRRAGMGEVLGSGSFLRADGFAGSGTTATAPGGAWDEDELDIL